MKGLKEGENEREYVKEERLCVHCGKKKQNIYSHHVSPQQENTNTNLLTHTLIHILTASLSPPWWPGIPSLTGVRCRYTHPPPAPCSITLRELIVKVILWWGEDR